MEKIKNLTILGLFFILILITGLLNSCKSNKADQSLNEIVFAAPRDITPVGDSFHPTSVICYTWEPLVGVDENWNPIPVLAKSWEMSEDGMQWTFKLRKGVKFHDGEVFNADAVLANFDRYQKTKGKNRFYTFRMNRYYPFFKSIEKVDDYTIRLSFSQPMETLTYYMANWGSSMHSPNSFDKNGDFITEFAASTGPYKVIEHKTDQYAILERFDGYWGEKAKAKRIRIKVIPDVNTRFSAMRSEEIQSVMDLGSITPSLAKELLKDDRFDISVSKNSILHFLGVNGTKFPFNSIKMRQALSLIIDRELISKEFFHGYFPPTVNILNYSSPFYKEIKIEHDPEKAKSLASEVLKNKKINIKILLSSESEKYPYKEISEYLQSVIEELGLTSDIRIEEKGAFNDTIKAGKYDLYLRTQGLPSGEALGIFNDYMRLEGTQGMNDTTQNKTYNYGYTNPEVDRLLDTAQSSVKIKEREEIYNKLQDIAAEEFPVIPIVNEATLIVYNKKITGFEAMIYGATLTNARWVK